MLPPCHKVVVAADSSDWGICSEYNWGDVGGNGKQGGNNKNLQQTYLCYDSCAGSGVLIVALHEPLP